MTVRFSVSLPDDVGAYLSRQRNASATVAESLRARMNDEQARQERRRASVAAYVDYLKANPVVDMGELDAATEEISLRGAGW